MNARYFVVLDIEIPEGPDPLSHIEVLAALCRAFDLNGAPKILAEAAVTVHDSFDGLTARLGEEGPH